MTTTTHSSHLEQNLLMNQLESILEHDNQLDEIGFIHPSQFAPLNEGSDAECAEEEAGLEYDDRVFWHRGHKLGISTVALLPLYKAARAAFFTAMQQCASGGEEEDDDLLKHSRALVLLSTDFATAWNSRKMVVSRRREHALLMDELRLSGLVLSYAPKSDQAWSHRRWVIKMIACQLSNLQDIMEKESLLVEQIAERYKMSYRAWYHRCWLVSYMTVEQMSHVLKDSRDWSGLHAADNSCFHYRRRLLLALLKYSHCEHGSNAFNYCSSSEVQKIWKEEFDWNESLIKRYIGREALWLHRRFLSAYYTKQTGQDQNISTFIDYELHLIQSCTRKLDDCFQDDAEAQVTHAATYALWLGKQVAHPQGSKLREFDLKTLLNDSSPEKILLWKPLLVEY
uniref:Uncharacterized protein n=1 Tax=Kalanchoe fedtschenkoi TaxID=63787 RepID=A0A7N0UZJ9_KALFE